MWPEPSCSARVAASGVAVALSPLAPLGPVRRVEHASVAFDWTVIGLGVAGLILVLSRDRVRDVLPAGAASGGPAGSNPAARIARRAHGRQRGPPRRRPLTGIRFALEPGAGPNAVPIRSAIIGAVLAVVVLTSTLTFGTSLRTLVSHPALYGWNWDYQLLAGFSGQEDLPQPQVTALLDHDRYVKAWAGVYFGGAEIDGHAVAVIGGDPESPGRTAAALGAQPRRSRPDRARRRRRSPSCTSTSATRCRVNSGQKQPATLRIVGTATMPTVGDGGSLHTTMGTGALLSYRLLPAADRNSQNSPVPGPNAILVRVATNVRAEVALRSLQQINDTINTPEGGGGDQAGGVVAVLPPAEIVNYRSTGTTPALLGATLAVGAVAALALTLIASVRRRRRELALLKTLGFTRRQLASVVAWQSTIAVAIGVVVGTPLGIILGRSLWNLFARGIHAVPDPTVPGLAIALIGVGALVLANLVAAVPGLQAARTRTALLLRAE